MPEAVLEWWGPSGFEATLAEMDVREGGRAHVAMRSPEFGTLYNIWSYTSRHAGRRQDPRGAVEHP